MNATAIGKRFNQHNSTNWSYLNLGKVALNYRTLKGQKETGKIFKARKNRK